MKRCCRVVVRRKTALLNDCWKIMSSWSFASIHGTSGSCLSLFYEHHYTKLWHCWDFFLTQIAQLMNKNVVFVQKLSVCLLLSSLSLPRGRQNQSRCKANGGGPLNGRSPLGTHPEHNVRFSRRLSLHCEVNLLLRNPNGTMGLHPHLLVQTQLVFLMLSAQIS